jgi:hypothetical protein
MPTIIDSFVAEFTIDSAGVVRGTGQVRDNLKKTRDDVDKSGKSFETLGRHGGEFLSKLRNEAVGLFLAFSGASSLTSFVKDVLTGDAATARLAGNIGMTTSRLSAWQLAIQQVGGDAKDADAALSSMAQAFQSYLLTGPTGHDADFKGLGVRYEDLKNPEQTLLRIAEAGERMNKVEFHARLQRLGLPESVINQLERGRVATEQLIAAKEKDGAATDADAAAAERLQSKLADIRSHILHFTRPAIYQLVDAGDALVTSMDDGKKGAPALALALGALAGVALLAGAPFVALAAAIAGVVVAANNLDSIGDLFQLKSGDKAEKEFEEYQKKQNAGHDAPSWRNAWGLFSLKRVPTDGGGGATAPAAPGPGGDGRRAYIRSYLKNASFSDAQIDGIVAGMTAENSTLDPNVRGGYKNRAVGIGQWLGDRRAALLKKYGRNPSLAQQMEFLVWELKGGDRGGASVRGETSAPGAGVAYLRDFMRPADGLPSDLRRMYGALGQKGPVGAGSGGRGNTDQSTHIGQLIVNDASGNPHKIAAQLPDAIRRRKLTTQANRGMG